MVRLHFAWIVVALGVGGCSDDGTAGTGETGAGTEASSSAEGSASLTSPSEPTTAPPTSTSADPTSAPTSSDSSEGGGSVSSGGEPTSSGSSSTDGTGSGSGSSSSGDASSSSTSGGLSELIDCNDAMPCPAGLECNVSFCCDGMGFCVPEGIDTCGGMLGDVCDDPTTVCVQHVCIADGTGVCVPSDFFDNELCVEQTSCWNGCIPD